MQYSLKPYFALSCPILPACLALLCITWEPALKYLVNLLYSSITVKSCLLLLALPTLFWPFLRCFNHKCVSSNLFKFTRTFCTGPGLRRRSLKIKLRPQRPEHPHAQAFIHLRGGMSCPFKQVKVSRKSQNCSWASL